MAKAFAFLGLLIVIAASFIVPQWYKAYLELSHEPSRLPPLHEAVRNKDFSTVIQLLQSGVDLNSASQAEFYPTPLWWALCNSDEKMVALLLSAGADPNKGQKGEAIFKLVIDTKKPKIYELFFKAGFNFKDNQQTPQKDMIDFAVKNNISIFLEFLATKKLIQEKN